MDGQTHHGSDAGDVVDFRKNVDENLGALLDMMTDLKRDLMRERDRLRDGETTAGDIAKIIKGDVGALLRLTIEYEGKLHDFTSERAGKAAEYALDFGRARSVIGGRLAQLRAANGAGPVSGQS